MSTDRAFYKIFPFYKGERSTFFFTKKKKVAKKKLANLRFDRWCVWKLHTAKPTRSARTPAQSAEQFA